MSPEEKEARRAKKAAIDKKYLQNKLASMSPEEKEAWRAKKAAQALLRYHRKRASMSPEEKKAQRAKQVVKERKYRQQKRASMSPEEKLAQRAKQAAYEKKHRQRKREERASCPVKREAWSAKRKLYRQQKVVSLSPEERQAERAKKNALAKQRRHERKYAASMSQDQEDENAEESCGYEIGVATTSPIQQARYHDQKRIMGVDGKPHACRAAVCVLCDRFIIGCESINKLTVDSLCSQKKKISVESYQDYHGVNLKKELVSQYQISTHEELEGLLLSPRAKQAKTKDGHVAFEACSSCYGAWQNKDCDSPPKFAISNGFAIGHVPTDVIEADNQITQQMSSLLAPVRPFAYIFAYTAGAHKAIRGHFSFFEVDLTHTGSVMNHFVKTGANPLVYVVLCGRMTPKQKQIVKDRAKLDTRSVGIVLSNIALTNFWLDS